MTESSAATGESTSARVARLYGVNETNNIEDFTSDFGSYLDNLADGGHHFHISEIKRFTRIRLLTEPWYPYMDLSYAFGELPDGRHCRVRLDSYKLGRKTYRSQIAAEVKAAGRNPNQMGVWDDSTYSIMR